MKNDNFDWQLCCQGLLRPIVPRRFPHVDVNVWGLFFFSTSLLTNPAVQLRQSGTLCVLWPRALPSTACSGGAVVYDGAVGRCGLPRETVMSEPNSPGESRCGAPRFFVGCEDDESEVVEDSIRTDMELYEDDEDTDSVRTFTQTLELSHIVFRSHLESKRFIGKLWRKKANLFPPT